jgi:hypothetical protein
MAIDLISAVPNNFDHISGKNAEEMTKRPVDYCIIPSVTGGQRMSLRAERSNLAASAIGIAERGTMKKPRPS